MVAFGLGAGPEAPSAARAAACETDGAPGAPAGENQYQREHGRGERSRERAAVDESAAGPDRLARAGCVDPFTQPRGRANAARGLAHQLDDAPLALVEHGQLGRGGNLRLRLATARRIERSIRQRGQFSQLSGSRGLRVSNGGVHLVQLNDAAGAGNLPGEPRLLGPVRTFHVFGEHPGGAEARPERV